MAWRTGAAENDADLDERAGPQHGERPPTGAANVLSESNHPAGWQRRWAISPQAKSRRGQSNGRSGTRLAKGGWMPKIPIAAAAKKAWIVLVILVVVAVAGFCVLPAPRHFRRPRQSPDHQRHGRRHQAVQSQARGL